MKIIHKLKKLNTIRYSTLLISAFFILLTFTILVLGSYMYMYNSKSMIDRSSLYYQKSLAFVGNSLSKYMSSIDSLAATISENKEVIDLLDANYEGDYYKQIKNSYQISSILSSFGNSNESIMSINIITNKIKNINNSNVNGVISEEFISGEFSNKTFKVADKGWYINHEQYISNNRLNSLSGAVKVISFFKNIYYKNNNKRLATIIINIKEPIFYDMIKQSTIDNDSEVVLLNEDKVIMSHPDKSLIGTTLNITVNNSTFLDSSNKKLIIFHKIDKYNWMIVQEIKVKAITKGIDNMMFYIVVISIIVLCSTALISVRISIAITNPIKELTKTVKKFAINGFNINDNHYKIEEVEILNSQFNEMVTNIKNLMLQIHQEQDRKRKTELKLLQAQINPHFIYNTIELINYIATKNKDYLVCEIVHAFGKMLRIGLNNGKNFLTIGQEVEHVTSYVRLQSFKYEDSFVVNWDIPPDVMLGFTIKFILQPLVENSIVHGFRKSKGRGIINITAKRIKNDVLITVEDNGTGIDENKRKEILTKYTKGYGVLNIHERIQKNFGENYGLLYYSSKLGGTGIEVKIPYIDNFKLLREDGDSDEI